MNKVIEDSYPIQLINLIEQKPELIRNINEILKICDELQDTYSKGGKVLICGNGGSASDSDHIVAELMKSFVIKRPLRDQAFNRLCQLYGEEGYKIASQLEESIPAISLTSSNSLMTSIANDIDSRLIFAQQVYGYGKPNDILLLISTSGKSINIIEAAKVGKAQGLKTIAFTGSDGGDLKDVCDISLCVPASLTQKIQEYHICTYHVICEIIEEKIFNKG